MGSARAGGGGQGGGQSQGGGSATQALGRPSVPLTVCLRRPGQGDRLSSGASSHRLLWSVTQRRW